MAAKNDQKTGRGGKRPGSGRKRKSPQDLRTEHLSARTTRDIKDAMDERCKLDRLTESDLIHRALEAYLHRREVPEPARLPAKRVVFVLQQVEIE